MKAELTSKHCTACEKGADRLNGEAIQRLRQELGEGWHVVDEHHLQKAFEFKNFKEALAFTNRVGEVAEQEGHHPDIFLTWGKVQLSLHTHSIDGLSENDFILAAKADQVR